ncbi:INO80 complex subunit B isoform X2 [Hyalella azteca]|nr:INO80 complex subunit B isoform X2 [Hyalella azteca]
MEIPLVMHSSMLSTDESSSYVFSPVGMEQPSRKKKSKKKDKNKDKSISKASKKEKKSSKRSFDEEDELLAANMDADESRTEKKKTSNVDNNDESDSEEERWLTAIEAGKLDEVDDELKRLRNPRLLTARQRALLDKQRPADADDLSVSTPPPTADAADVSVQDTACLSPHQIPPEPLVALPSGFKEKVVTREMLEKRALKSERRKAQALVKREEDKRKTVDRLLKKQDPKLLRSAYPKKAVTSEVVMFSYRSDASGVYISLPPHCDYPLQRATAREKPKPVMCGVAGCGNLKRYSCSRTGVALCSLACYKTNLAVTDNPTARVA